MTSVWKRLKPYGGLVALTLGLVMVQALAELGLPTLMAGIIDRGVLGGDQGAIFSGGLAMVALAAAAAVASVAAAWASSRMGAGFGRDLRSAVFRKATALGPDQFQSLGAASLITRTTNDVTQVQSLAVMSLRMMAMAPLMAIGGLVMAFSLDAELALVLAVVVPLLALAIALLATQAMKLFQIVQEKVDRLNLVLRESLTGVRVIRAFDRQNFDAQRFDAANLDLAAISLQTQKLMSVVMPGMMFAMSLASVALVWFGGMRIQAGSLQVGGLMAFLQYSTQILFSLMMMSMLFVILPRAAVSARRIAEVLEAPQAPGTQSGGATPVSETVGLAVEFRRVTFRYPGAEQAALAEVSFTAPAGRTTAIIGGTGSGKSTVLQLVGRFHDATEGQVLVGGLDVKDWDRSALRARIGLSPQQARLFTGTVAENLRWGRADASTDQMNQAVATAQAQDFVQGLDDGLEGKIDQAGANLSGGQKQRLTIARALVRGAGVLLFDDSFSALDAGTDARLRQALNREIQGTVIVVAQRVATVRDADHIVVLDDGRVAGAGTHDALLASCPVYQEIVASQEGGEEAE
jgi:ATP-binding cassette subfamily B multidrug efflux pump